MSNSPKLQIGAKAPDFEFTLTRGNAMSLAQIAEKGPVLINFIKGSWNNQYMNYIRNLRRWQSSMGKKNVTLVVISADKVETLREWTKANTIDFLFGSVNETSTFEEFGVTVKANETAFMKPTTFLVDTDLTVRLILDEDRAEATTATPAVGTPGTKAAAS